MNDIKGMVTIIQTKFCWFPVRRTSIRWRYGYSEQKQRGWVWLKQLWEVRFLPEGRVTWAYDVLATTEHQPTILEAKGYLIHYIEEETRLSKGKSPQGGSASTSSLSG